MHALRRCQHEIASPGSCTTEAANLTIGELRNTGTASKKTARTIHAKPKLSNGDHESCSCSWCALLVQRLSVIYSTFMRRSCMCFRNSSITSKRDGDNAIAQLLNYSICYQGGACEVLDYERPFDDARNRLFLHLFFARSPLNLHLNFAGNTQLRALLRFVRRKAPHVVRKSPDRYKCGHERAVDGNGTFCHVDGGSITRASQMTTRHFASS